MQTPNSELEATLYLSKCKGIGPINAKQALNYYGSATEVLKQPGIELKQTLGFNESQIEQIRSVPIQFKSIVYQELKYIETTQTRLVRFDQTEYPVRLKQIVDAPFALYVKGNANLNPSKTLAIVGTRKPSSHSLFLTQQLIEAAQQSGIHIVSGLAYGIDIAAHRASLKYQLPTVGVLAHGLDQIYPTAHSTTANEMIQTGALITEMSFLTKLHPDLFPRRNRIIAGLSDAVLVVESKLTGGSMSTAQIARSYDREVFAFPGNPAQGHNTGCNALIKRQVASLVEGFDDIVKSMNWNFKSKDVTQFDLFPKLNSDEQLILNLLTGRKLHIDELIQISGIALHRITLAVLELELKGVLKVLPGKYYQRVA